MIQKSMSDKIENLICLYDLAPVFYWHNRINFYSKMFINNIFKIIYK